ALLYLFEGSLTVNGETLRLEHTGTLSDGDRVTLAAGEDGARLLLLAGKPIGEP
ncbi:MAG TPA: quercetin 2,3-dioxygenase, partial [Alcanivorax sp.]|nr:quercetin 2,3-dioxygenase [Alcanivorax sp.]